MLVSTVLYRIFGLTPGMEAVERDSSIDSIVTVEVQVKFVVVVFCFVFFSRFNEVNPC